MNKNEIRIVYKAARRNVAHREEKESALVRKLLAEIGRPFSVFCYESIGGEVSTAYLIEQLSAFSEVFVPEVRGKDMLLKSLRTGNYADKPCEATVVPLIAFDETLNRVGFGGGYYDRYLAANRTRTFGIAFDEQQCETFEKEVTDIPLDVIVTPTRILRSI